MHIQKLQTVNRQLQKLLVKRGYVVQSSALVSTLEKEESHQIEEEQLLDPKWSKWWDGSFSKHPGKCRIPAVHLPRNFQESATQYLSDYYKVNPRDKVLTVCGKLCNVLAHRPLQIKLRNDTNPSTKLRRSKKILNKNELLELFHPDEESGTKVEKLLWRKIAYDHLNTAAYLIGRAPAVYATTLRVLSEIKNRNPDFQPQAMLDYGSGTGTSIWAANSVWGSNLQDFYCVDWSHSMNQLSQFLLTGGNENAELTGIFLRPFLPISFTHNFDIVTAAYTLSELPSEKERLTTLKLLWEKTTEYLVIIEQGNQQGYHMVMEARNLIAHGIEGAEIKKTRRFNNSIEQGHIFAPCPHKMQCPKWRQSPCTFSQSYFPPLYSKKFHGKDGAVEEKFSYIILSKSKAGLVDWPRAVADPHHRADKIHCHLCMANGNIEHLYMKKETHDRDIRHAAKKTLAGDLLPYWNNKS